MRVTRTSAPVREQAARILQNAIVRRHFKPGQRLVERELCDLLGASRTTVREALRQLEAEGFVKVVPGKGSVAVPISLGDAVGLYQVREVLEGLAGRLFAENASDHDLIELEAISSDLDVLATRNPQDVESILAIKDRFYEVLFQRAGNPVLHTLAGSVHLRVTLFRSMSLSAPGRVQESVHELRRIVEALRKRNPEEAQAMCAAHVRNAGKEVTHALQRELEPSELSAGVIELSTDGK